MTDEAAAPDQSMESKIDTSVSHSARIWNYWLGGKDNFAIDRQVGDQVREVLPEIVECALADRAFLGRVVTHLVDNDPLVLVHARALLTGSSDGVTDYIDGDLRDPEAILDRARQTLDFSKPVAVMLLGVLHYLGDDDEAYSVVNHVMSAVPPGSFLALQAPTNAVTGERMEEAVRRWNEAGGATIYLRTPEQLARFYTGMELLEPGVVSCSRWRFDEGNEVDVFGAVGRKL